MTGSANEPSLNPHDLAANSAERTSAEQAPASPDDRASQDEDQSSGMFPKPRIKIGSQRESPSPADSVETPSPVRSTNDLEAAAPEPKDAGTLGAGAGTPALAREQPAVGTTEEAPNEGPLPPEARKKFPPPNIRKQLPAELEAEVEAALAGKSLDEWIGRDRPGAQTAAELPPETSIRGRIVSVYRENVFVDLAQPHQGVLSLRQFAEPPAVGTQLDVVVNQLDAEEGLYSLSLPGGAVEIGDWSQLNEGLIVEARITGHNKGGLECEVNHIRGFIPASQVARYRVEDLSQFVGEKWACIVTEAKREKRNLVLSRRALLEREQQAARQQLLAELAPGQVREGTVRSMQPFGAFVDLGGVDGLIHVSQISWSRINDPSEVLQLGQRLNVRILKVDPETGKISLGLKDLAESPWTNAATKYPVKSQVRGKVTKLMDFGAFVELEPGIEGLVHVSELDHKRVWRPSDVVSVGQEVDVQVLSIDPQAHRIGLSMKALAARPEPTKPAEAEQAEPEPAPAQRVRKTALKGGRDRIGGGEQFGLKW